MRFGRENNEETPEFQMAPMIDVVFLLLIFFLCASHFQMEESELKANLPVSTIKVPSEDLPDDVVIDIDAAGRITINKTEYDSAASKELSQLRGLLLTLKELYQDQGVVIAAESNTRHERIVDVLNACAGCEIKNISFYPPE